MAALRVGNKNLNRIIFLFTSDFSYFCNPFGGVAQVVRALDS